MDALDISTQQTSGLRFGGLRRLPKVPAGSGGLGGNVIVSKEAHVVRYLGLPKQAPEQELAGSFRFSGVKTGSGGQVPAGADSGPSFRSKLLRRLASRLAIVASKLLLYKLGIHSNALHVWFIVVASWLPWRTHASQHHSLGDGPCGRAGWRASGAGEREHG